MMGRKKRPDMDPLFSPPEPHDIKENIGEVSRRGMDEVGIDIGPLMPPRPPARMAPRPLARPLQPAPIPAMQRPAMFLPRPPVSQAPRPAPSMPATQEQKNSPPLFIKIERYRELLQNISQLKSFALSLRDALDALSDIEKELKNTLGVTQGALDRLNGVMTDLDSKLLRVGGEEIDNVMEMPREMDEYIKGLYDNIERIKHEIRTISD